MGNFYVNIVLREPDVGAVASALETLRRRAYVAADGGVAVVFDERCDLQDQQEIEKLAGALSKRLRCTALAFLNHDDDVLWYALVDDGRIVDRYESFPGYFTGGSDTPSGGDAPRLCAAFGATGREPPVAALLRRTHHDVGLEIDRHTELLELLNIPVDLAVFGYGYVSAGELGSSNGAKTLRAVGGAPPPRGHEDDRPPAAAANPSADITAAAAAAMRSESAQVMPNSAVLAFNQVQVPTPLAGILGSGSMNAYSLMLRLQRYIVSQKLIEPLGMVKANAVLAELLGEQEFSIVALPRLLRRALRLPMLSAEDVAALSAGNSPILVRFFEAMRRAAEEVQHDDG